MFVTLVLGIYFTVMIWIDVSIALLAGIAQFATAYLGWQVTVTPLAPQDAKRKQRYQRIFWIAGTVGVVAVSAAAIRGGDLGGQVILLQRQLASAGIPLRPDLRNTAKYEVDTAQPGKRLKIRVSVENAGSADALDVSSYFAAVVTDAIPDPDGYSSYLGRLVATVHEKVSKLAVSSIDKRVSPDRKISAEVQGDELSEAQLRNFQAGSSRLYVAGSVYYKTLKGGMYEGRYCAYFTGDLKTPKDCAGDFDRIFKGYAATQ
jgi:hypothetical protein